MDPVSAVYSMVQQNNSWSAEQAQKQMDFQEQMSNTAHQREVADLKAAGLNPVLSAKLGGASSPSGAMGSFDSSGTSALIEALKSFGEGIAHSAASGASSGFAGTSAKSEVYGPVYDPNYSYQGQYADGKKAAPGVNALVNVLPYAVRSDARSAVKGGPIEQAARNLGNAIYKLTHSNPQGKGKPWHYTDLPY